LSEVAFYLDPETYKGLPLFYKGIKDYLAPSILANNGYEKVNNASGRFYASELEVKGIWGENYKKST
jgi:hypothetical protein